MRKLYLAMGMALVAMLVAAGAVYAAVTFDPATGTGFVGKGDVQTALNLNNAQLQSAQISFRAIKVYEQSWECTNARNEKIQVRNRTTTAQAVVSSTARVRNQITGFNLNGYDPNQPEVVISTEGPPVNSCPAPQGDWTLTSPAGDPVLISTTLQVSKDGTNFVSLT